MKGEAIVGPLSSPLFNVQSQVVGRALCLLSYLAIRRISIYCCYVLFHLFMSRCCINYISALQQIKYHSDH